MKLDTVKKLLTQLEIPVTPMEVSGIWHNFRCPFAPWYHKKGIDSHPSFGVSVTEDNRSHYKCLSCGTKGSLALLPAKLGKLRNVDYSDLVHWAEHAEFDESGPPLLPEWADEQETKIVNAHGQEKESTKNLPNFGGVIGHPYLRVRGYTALDAVRLDLRFDENQQRILFPVYNKLLQLEGYTGRSVMPDHMISKGKGNNPKSRDYGGLKKDRLFLFNRRWGVHPERSRIILVEGPFDYARCVQAGYRGTHAILGTALTDHKINYLVEANKPVTLFLDHDTAGDAAAFGNVNTQTLLRENTHLAWAERLFNHVPVWVARYPDRAVFENRNDPDSLSVHEIREAISRAWLYQGIFKLPEYQTSNDEIPF